MGSEVLLGERERERDQRRERQKREREREREFKVFCFSKIARESALGGEGTIRYSDSASSFPSARVPHVIDFWGLREREREREIEREKVI